MNPLKPLLYLTYKTTFNGLKRAVTTPRRLVYFVFFCLYYFYLINRVAFVNVSPNGEVPARFIGLFQFPPLQVVDSLAFGLFVLGWIFMLVSVPNYQNNARPADVDVLFATPMSPKIVLAFKIARDYFFTLITPLFIVILGMRATRMGWESIFRGYPHPELSGLVVRSLALSWILMAFCYVGIVHAVGLYTFRSDRKSDRNRLMLQVAVGAFVLALAGLVIRHFFNDPGMQGLVDLAESPVMRAVFFLPTCAAEITLAPFRGTFVNATLGASGLGLTIFLSLRVALSQASWYYDQAAARGNSAQNLRQLQRRGDFAALAAERARTGKFRVHTPTWLMKVRVQGASAIVWKELLVQPRTMLPMMIFLLIVQAIMAGTCAFAPTTSNVPLVGGYILTFSQGFWCLMVVSIMGQSGFNEVLRKGDLIKAFPSPPFAIVRNEILGRSFFGVFGTLLGCLLFVGFCFAQWQIAVASALFWSAIVILFTACTFFVTLLFPDTDDQTQRQFRSLMMMLAFAATGLLPIGLFALLLIFHLWPLACALAGVIAALAIAAVLFLISGSLYASYNPSE